MIFDKIQNHQTYRESVLLDKVLTYMATCWELPDQPVELSGRDAFVNPVEFTTKPESQCLYEAHQNYADVHFILEGEEKIIVREIHEVKEHTPYSQEKDIGFYTADCGTEFILRPGDFLVCYPQDAHKVAIAPHSPAPVKKLVGKVRVN